MVDGAVKEISIFSLILFFVVRLIGFLKGRGAGKMLAYIKSLSTTFTQSSIGLRFYMYSYIMDAKYPKSFGGSDHL